MPDRPAWFEAAWSAYVSDVDRPGTRPTRAVQAACQVAVRAELEAMAAKIKELAQLDLGPDAKNIIEEIADMLHDRADELKG